MYCNQRFCLSVCLCVCPRSYVKNHKPELHEISSDYPWQWLRLTTATPYDAIFSTQWSGAIYFN